MKEFMVKVTTKSGYMLFMVKTYNKYRAKIIIDNKIDSAGWENYTVEVVND